MVSQLNAIDAQFSIVLGIEPLARIARIGKIAMGAANRRRTIRSRIRRQAQTAKTFPASSTIPQTPSDVDG